MNDNQASEQPAWWRCPNEPPCQHGAVFHDLRDLDDPTPRCCVEGCSCGEVPADG